MAIQRGRARGRTIGSGRSRRRPIGSRTTNPRIPPQGVTARNRARQRNRVERAVSTGPQPRRRRAK